MIILGPDSTHAGHFTMLYCSAASVPSATFTWLFTGSPTSVHGAVYIIQSSSSRDHGRYTCTAVNAVTGHSETVHHELSVTGVWRNKQNKYNIYLHHDIATVHSVYKHWLISSEPVRKALGCRCYLFFHNNNVGEILSQFHRSPFGGYPKILHSWDDVMTWNKMV